MVRVVYPGSYKQIQTDSPVFIRTTGRSAYIGRKKARTLFNELVVVSCKGDLRIDRKICKNERSKNRGLPIKRCGVKAMFRHSTKKVFYLCNACNKEFHEDGDKFKLNK